MIGGLSDGRDRVEVDGQLLAARLDMGGPGVGAGRLVHPGPIEGEGRESPGVLVEDPVFVDPRSRVLVELRDAVGGA